jgi:hypothetical protein
VTVTEANPDLAALRRRLILMAAVVGVCAIVALVSVVCELRFHMAWARWTFILALLAGFGAQGWLIVGFIRQGRAGK